MVKDGNYEEMWVSMELHHVSGRKLDDMPVEYMDEIARNRMHCFEGLEPVWPWEHAARDPHRHINYKFEDFIEVDYN